MIIKSFKLTLLPFLLMVLLLGCQTKDPNEITVGVISGPETQLMEVAKSVAAKKYGLKIKIVQFSDYNIPNEALNDGSLDANVFQHQTYLDNVISRKHYALVAIGKTFIYPMGIYSLKIKNINQVPMHAIAVIPNDPSNEARALLLLSKTHLITLKAGVTTSATPLDIVENPKKIIFKELDAAQLPRSLPDASLAIINSNYAVVSGLYPNKDAIFLEDVNSPYANLVVIKSTDINNSKLKQLVLALHSPEVQEEARKLFRGQAIPAW